MHFLFHSRSAECVKGTRQSVIYVYSTKFVIEPNSNHFAAS
jgi:hypothetical protein